MFGQAAGRARCPHEGAFEDQGWPPRRVSGGEGRPLNLVLLQTIVRLDAHQGRSYDPAFELTLRQKDCLKP